MIGGGGGGDIGWKYLCGISLMEDIGRLAQDGGVGGNTCVGTHLWRTLEGWHKMIGGGDGGNTCVGTHLWRTLEGWHKMIGGGDGGNTCVGTH